MLIKLRLAGTKNYGAILRHLILDATLVDQSKTPHPWQTFLQPKRPIIS